MRADEFTTVVNNTDISVPEELIIKVISQGRSVLNISSVRSVAVVCVDADRIKYLNKEYRGKHYVTDVLSFNPGEKEELGDIIICNTRVKEQSEEKGHSFQKEFIILLVHGLVHLAGYDHEKDADAEKMNQQERAIISKLDL